VILTLTQLLTQDFLKARSGPEKVTRAAAPVRDIDARG
jgi:hypothetical protein